MPYEVSISPSQDADNRPQSSALEAGTAGAINGLTFGGQNKLAGAAAATGGALRRALPQSAKSAIDNGPKTTTGAAILGAVSAMPGVSTLVNLIALAGSKSEGEDWGDTYKRVRQASENYNNQLQEEHPVAYGVGQVAGALPATVVDPLDAGSAVRGAVNVAKGLGKGVKTAKNALGLGEKATTAAEDYGTAMNTEHSAEDLADINNKFEQFQKFGYVPHRAPSTAGVVAKNLAGGVATGSMKGAAQGAVAGAASDDSNDGLMGNVESGLKGAIGGGAAGALLAGPLASKAGALLNTPVLDVAAGIKLAEMKGLSHGVPKILASTSKAAGEFAKTAGGVSGQLAGSGIGQVGNESDDENQTVDIDGLLKQLNVDPSTPDGSQKAQQLSQPDYTNKARTDEDGTPSSDVPQVKIVNGKKVLTTPSGTTVELN